MNELRRQSPTAPDALREHRQRLEEVDRAIVALLASRFRIVAELWAEKRRVGLPLRDPRQETSVRYRAQRWGREDGITTASVDRVFRIVLEEGRRYAGRVPSHAAEGAREPRASPPTPGVGEPLRAE